MTSRPGAGAGIARDGRLVRVAEIVAAAVVGLEDDGAVGGDELRRRREAQLGGRRRSAMDVEHERILAAGVEVGRIRHDPVGLELVGAPRHALGAAQGHGAGPRVERRQRLRCRRCGGHHVQLGRRARRGGGEDEETILAALDVGAEAAGEHQVAQRQALRRAGERLDPGRHRRLVGRGNEHSRSVGKPIGPQDVPVERAGDAAWRAPAGRRDVHLGDEAAFAVAVTRLQERDVAAIGRPEGEALERLHAGERLAPRRSRRRPRRCASSRSCRSAGRRCG